MVCGDWRWLTFDLPLGVNLGSLGAVGAAILAYNQWFVMADLSVNSDILGRIKYQRGKKAKLTIDARVIRSHMALLELIKLFKQAFANGREETSFVSKV